MEHRRVVVDGDHASCLASPLLHIFYTSKTLHSAIAFVSCSSWPTTLIYLLYEYNLAISSSFCQMFVFSLATYTFSSMAMLSKRANNDYTVCTYQRKGICFQTIYQGIEPSMCRNYEAAFALPKPRRRSISLISPHNCYVCNPTIFSDTFLGDYITS